MKTQSHYLQMLELPTYKKDQLAGLLDRAAECNASDIPEVNGDLFNRVVAELFMEAADRAGATRLEAHAARNYWSASWGGEADYDAARFVMDCIARAMLDTRIAELEALAGAIHTRNGVLAAWPREVMDIDRENQTAMISIKLR